MARIVVYLPNSAANKIEKMFIIVPGMEVNFPSDFKIRSRILSVRSKKAPLYATVSLYISSRQTRCLCYLFLYLTSPAPHRMSNASIAISTFRTVPSVGTSQSGAS